MFPLRTLFPQTRLPHTFGRDRVNPTSADFGAQFPVLHNRLVDLSVQVGVFRRNTSL